jgi:hypothetical protein
VLDLVLAGHFSAGLHVAPYAGVFVRTTAALAGAGEARSPELPQPAANESSRDAATRPSSRAFETIIA